MDGVNKNEDRGEGSVCVCVCVCVWVYERALDGFIVGRAEQMGPHYQRVQLSRIQPSVIRRYLQ